MHYIITSPYLKLFNGFSLRGDKLDFLPCSCAPAWSYSYWSFDCTPSCFTSYPLVSKAPFYFVNIKLRASGLWHITFLSFGCISNVSLSPVFKASLPVTSEWISLITQLFIFLIPCHSPVYYIFGGIYIYYIFGKIYFLCSKNQKLLCFIDIFIVHESIVYVSLLEYMLSKDRGFAFPLYCVISGSQYGLVQSVFVK